MCRLGYYYLFLQCVCNLKKTILHQRQPSRTWRFPKARVTSNMFCWHLFVKDKTETDTHTHKVYFGKTRLTLPDGHTASPEQSQSVSSETLSEAEHFKVIRDPGSGLGSSEWTRETGTKQTLAPLHRRHKTGWIIITTQELASQPLNVLTWLPLSTGEMWPSVV